MNGLAAIRFLPDSFEDQHVRIHRHADCQQYAGYAGQSESCSEQTQHPGQQHQVENQRPVSHQPAGQIIETDKHKDDQSGHKNGAKPARDGVTP